MDLGVRHAGVEIVFANDYEPPKKFTKRTTGKLQPQVIAYQHNLGRSEPAKTLLARYYEKGPPSEVYQPPMNHEEKPLTDAVYKHAKEHNIGYNASPVSPASTIRTKGEDVADFANHSEKDYWTPPSEYTYDQANRVQSMDEPCNTIPAHHNSGQPIHPTQKPRRFTVRECLRLQSAPDSYVLPDTISLSAMYKIVGNGVPSRLAYHLTVALTKCLLS